MGEGIKINFRRLLAVPFKYTVEIKDEPNEYRN